MKSVRYILFGLLAAAILAACGQTPVVTTNQEATQMPAVEQSYTPQATLEPTITLEPTPTYTLEPTSTKTVRPSPTPLPINYVTLGSPFASDCGDGIPRIWSNDSFNGPFKLAFDEHHGHVDLFVPIGCDVNLYEGEVLAPVSGDFKKLSESYQIFLPYRTYLTGIVDALKFSGVVEPKLELISQISLDFGHINHLVIGPVIKGQKIADIVPYGWQQKLAYQIVVVYDGNGFLFSPTLFLQDGPEWICVPNSPYDCEPEPVDYAH